VGEYTVGDKTKVFWQYVVHADFIEHWERIQSKYGFNGHTVLWAPGVKESAYCVELFQKAGVTAAHIDGDTSDDERDRMLAAHKAGEIKVLCSCGVLRAGVDMPWARHGILMQACGAYSNWIQMTGRLMRADEDKPLCVIQDHSGCFYRHGDPNEDRVWIIGDSDRKIAKQIQERFETGEGKEPTRCPECGGIRFSKFADPCPHCGWSYVKSVRLIRIEDGTLVRKVGNVFKKKKTFSQEESVWRSCLYACAAKRMTVQQAAGWFKQRTGQWPQGEFKSAALPAEGSIDWSRRVGEVYPWLLRRKKQGSL
jgi:DNA repair protein RadD